MEGGGGGDRPRRVPVSSAAPETTWRAGTKHDKPNEIHSRSAIKTPTENFRNVQEILPSIPEYLQ